MKRMWMAALVIVALGLFVGFAGCTKQNDMESEVKGKDADMTTDASTLARAYATNAVVGDGTYGEKILEVTGTVEKVFSSAGNRVVELTTGNPSLLIDCYFSEAHKAELDKVSAGDEVTIKGKCMGMTKYVDLQGCIFVGPQE